MGSSAAVRYPWPSTVNVANFVSVKPWLKHKETNNHFNIWKEQMICLFESQNLLGFVDGEILPPPPREEGGSGGDRKSDEQKKRWKKTDRLVKGWILGSIGDDVLSAVVENLNVTDSSSREVWLGVEHIFHQIKYLPANLISDDTILNEEIAREEDGNLSNFMIVGQHQGHRIIEDQPETSAAALETINRYGQILPPTPPSDEELSRITETLIKGWMLGLIEEDEFNAVVEKLNSKDWSSGEVWLELEKIFSKIEPNQGLISDTILNEEVVAQGEGGNQNNGPMGQNRDRVVTDQSDTSTSNPLDRTNSWRKDLALYKAALKDDWRAAMGVLDESKHGITMDVDSYLQTVLQAAVSTGKSNDFVRKLLELMRNGTQFLKGVDGHTALHFAAVVGNTEAAMILVNENPNLLYILSVENKLPVHAAAIHSHKDTFIYLISAHEKDQKSKKESGKEVHNNPFEGSLGVSLLMVAIASEFIDVALNLVQKYPDMGTFNDEDSYAMYIIAGMKSVFPSGASFSWWQNWIYSRIPITSASKLTGDIENQISYHGANKFSWLQIISRVPLIKIIRDKKLMHQQSLELVKCLCERLETLPEIEASSIYRKSMLKAAYEGIHEVVEVILDMYPMAVHLRDAETSSNIFLLAARKRLENVFNIIYQLDDRKHIFYDSRDSSRNNFMHMCAELAPPHKLNLVSGPALQMQRELQWFKEMEKFVNPSRRLWANDDGHTAKMLFTKEHQKLKAEGEKWMKDTANSCTFVAALIATVMYAAAFQVPGGLETSSGVANFWDKVPFILFAISDTISLFTSVTSLLMFVAILTSRYAEEDFLYVLPKRLCTGLLTLFISIIFMMIAFGATLYLVFWKKYGWFLLPVAALASLPITSFVLLQFPLLVDVMYSTYGPGIFDKKSNRTLY